jgi:hypothetical protein
MEALRALHRQTAAASQNTDPREQHVQNLLERRDATALAVYERLKNALGPLNFARIDSRLRQTSGRQLRRR